MQPVFGDVYDIDRRVREYDPTYRLVWNHPLKRYQVVATKRKAIKEGVLNGHPLYVLRDVDEIVFTWDVQGMAPDMRIIWHLHETDVWRYPGGPEKFYDDHVRSVQRDREKREERVNEDVAQAARESHAQVFEKRKTFVM